MSDPQLFDVPADGLLPPGLELVEGYIDEDQERALAAALDAEPWQQDLRRRVQHYGYRYSYRGDGSRLAPGEDLPAWLVPLTDALAPRFKHGPDQVIVNEYEPGQGIAAHVDRVDVFGPTVVSLSLLDSWPMRFSSCAETVDLLLPQRSLLVLTGPARTTWSHGIAPRLSDPVSGGRRARRRRLSLTFRTVTPASRGPR